MANRTITFAYFWLFCFKVFSSVPLDLNTFNSDPTVTISSDGQSAILQEDAGFAQVLLWNDPNSGAEEVIVAGVGVHLQFDYEFTEGEGEADEFGAFVINSTGSISEGALDFFTSESGSGTITFDLSPLAGEPLVGLQFQLSSTFGDTGATSTLMISNIQVGVPLSVRTQPAKEVTISGSPGGTTDYQCLIPSGQEISLTAPGTLTGGDYDLTFDHWTVNNIPQDPGEITLTLVVQADVEVVATYLAQMAFALKPGWNFISSPLALDSGSSENFFSAYRAWKWEDSRFKVARNLEPGKGYWVHNGMSSIQTMEVKGSIPPESVRFVDKGWQTIGILENQGIPPIMNEKISGRVWRWNEETQRLFVVTHLTFLEPRQGYWLYLREGTELALGVIE